MISLLILSSLAPAGDLFVEVSSEALLAHPTTCGAVEKDWILEVNGGGLSGPATSGGLSGSTVPPGGVTGTGRTAKGGAAPGVSTAFLGSGPARFPEEWPGEIAFGSGSRTH